MYMFFHLIFFFNCICQWSLMVSALLNLLLVDPISSSICHSWLPFWNTFFCWFSGHHILLPLVGWFAASLAITTSHPAQYMLVCSCAQPFPSPLAVYMPATFKLNIISSPNSTQVYLNCLPNKHLSLNMSKTELFIYICRTPQPFSSHCYAFSHLDHKPWHHLWLFIPNLNLICQ